MSSFRSVFAFLVLVLLILGPHKAQAAFLFCNKTADAIETAFGVRDGSTWISEGWWRVLPGKCARVLGTPLSQRFYYYYARSLGKLEKSQKEPRVWDGKFSFCIDDKAFRIEGDSYCKERGYHQRGFMDVDVGTYRKDYTVTFKD